MECLGNQSERRHFISATPTHQGADGNGTKIWLREGLRPLPFFWRHHSPLDRVFLTTGVKTAKVHYVRRQYL